MKLSIIVLTYNSEKYLDKCLRSIYLNMSKGDELIIIDNNSSDKTKEILKKYYKRSNTKIYLSDQNLGVSDGRNFGASISKNDFLAFIDSDIVLHKNSLENAKKSFDNKASSMIGLYDEIGSGLNWFVEAIREIYASKRKKNFKKQVNYKNYTTFSGGLCIIKKDIFLEYNGYSNKYDNYPSEDINFELRLIRDNKIIYFERKFSGTHYKGKLTFKGFIKKYYKNGVAVVYLIKMAKEEKYKIPFNNQWPYLPVVLPLEILCLVLNKYITLIPLILLILYRIIPVLFSKLKFTKKIGFLILRIISDIVMFISIVLNINKVYQNNDKVLGVELANENNQ